MFPESVNVPAFTVVVPAMESFPEIANLPVPALMRPPVPLSAPEKVEERLLALLPMVSVVPPAVLSTALPLPDRLPIVGEEPLKLDRADPEPAVAGLAIHGHDRDRGDGTVGVQGRVVRSGGGRVGRIDRDKAAPSPPVPVAVNVPPLSVVPPL